MIWLILSLIAALLWSISNIIDKHVVSYELKRPAVVTGIVSLFQFSLFIVFSVVVGVFTKVNFFIDLKYIIIAIIIGVVYDLAFIFYYNAMERGDVDRVGVITETTPLFVMLLATLFLDEILILRRYVGIFIIVLGALFVSYKIKDIKEKATSKIWILFVFIATFLFASRNVLVKYSTNFVPYIVLIFWMAYGCLLMSIILSFVNRKKIKSLKMISKRIKLHLLLSTTISFTALMCFIYATFLYKVSIVASIASVKTLFLFVITAIIVEFRPSIVKERITFKSEVIKLIGVILIIVGVWAVVS